MELANIEPIIRTVNRDAVTWDADNRVFFAHDLALGWYGEPVVLVSPETGESIRFSKLEIQLRFHTGDIDSWILRGADHPWELLIKADSDEICRRKV
jgi:hypothetical protein